MEKKFFNVYSSPYVENQIIGLGHNTRLDAAKAALRELRDEPHTRLLYRVVLTTRSLM